MMHRIGLFFAFCTTCAFAGNSIRVLVDRPGTWEAEWTGAGWDEVHPPDGSTGFSNARGLPAAYPGDLLASRLGLLIALPPVGDWNLSFPADSGSDRDCALPARVPRWDPETRRNVVVAPASPPQSSLESKDGFRMLHLDLPLARQVAGGRIRLTHRLRIKLEWSGRIRVRSGSIWKGVVDNPGGVESRPSFAARSLRMTKSDSLTGNIASFELGDDSLFRSGEDGLVRISGRMVADALKIDVRGIRMSSIAVWSGAADTLRSQADSVGTGPSLRPIPLQRRDLDHDDVFGPDDEILFWAHGPNLWKPDSSSVPGWNYSIHPYARTRRYLIRWDAAVGSPELEPASIGGSPRAFAQVAQPVNIGKPVNRLESMFGESLTEKDMGVGWFWLTGRGGVSLRLADSSGRGLPEIGSDSGLLKVRLAKSGKLQGHSNNISTASIEGGKTWTAMNGTNPFEGVWSGTGLASGSAFRIGFSASSELAIQDYQVTYFRDVSRLDSALFPAPAMGSVAILAKDGLACWVLENGVAVRACQIRDGTLRDSVRVPGTWYALFPSSSPGIRPKLAKWSEALGSHVVKDFNAARKADVLVVSPRAFLSVAEEYAKHREAAFQVRPMKVAVVALEDLFDLWSGGMSDPVAIRDAIRWTSQNWQISYALLLGGGHSDPRNVLRSSPESLIPHWQYLDGSSSESSDDFYAGLVSNGAWAADVYVGRVPARTAPEANAWLTKLEIFEDPAKAEFGPWRNRIVYTADDMLQNSNYDKIEHTEQVEEVVRSVDSARPWIRSDKIYLVQYPANAIFQKPEAARDLQNIINQGVSGMCYLGHGGMGLLADEDLLDVPAIERTLKNSTTPFLFSAGSCTVGRNDLPNARGLADALVVSAGRGAYATIAATRPTYPGPNTLFTTELWTDLTSSHNRDLTLGEALLKAKLKAADPSNSQRYNLLGDPSTVPYPGGLVVQPDSIGDTLAAFSKVRFAGSSGSAGRVQNRIEIPLGMDTARLDYKKGNFTTQYTQVFELPSQQLLSSQVEATGGGYSSTVGLPARVPFGSSAFIKTYAWDPKTRRDGGAKSNRKVFWGTSNAGFSDHEGPQILVSACDSSWSGGLAFNQDARFPLPFCLSIAIQDTSGVSFDQGPDEGLVLSLPGVREAWHPDLRQVSDYRSASANLILDSTMVLPGGSYPLDVSACDLMGNLSRTRVLLHPQYAGEAALYQVFNSPNPVRSGGSTAFFFKLSADADTNGSVDSRATASIRIHSVSGRLVRILRTELSNGSAPRPQAIWDLRDSFGNPVANGLYPFTVILRIPSAEGMASIQREAKGTVAISR